MKFMLVRKSIYGFIFLLCLLIITSFKKHNSAIFLPEQIKVEGGYISGSSNAAKDVRIFKGIPFAAPPVGNLRWKAPQPVPVWKGVKACTQFGPSPMQAKPA